MKPRATLIIVATLCVCFQAIAAENPSPSAVGIMEPFYPGQPMIIDSESPNGRWAVMFEDDGETGYLYALDLDEQKSGRNPIQEALHIYNVKNVVDKDKQSAAAVVWSSDGQKACLLINRYPHAVVDFSAKRGYCRTNFPEPGKWKERDFKWDDKVLEYFRR